MITRNGMKNENGEAVVTLNNVTIGYDRHHVREHLSLALQKGKLTCLTGANGVGKSTLMRTLAGFLPPRGGCVRLLGREVQEWSPQALSERVAVVLTERPTMGFLRVQEVVAMGRAPYTGLFGRLQESDHRAVEDAMALMEVTPLAFRRMNSLSDGERQKVMVAMALARQTPVLLLDEPTAFLDHDSKVALMKRLRKVAHEQGVTVLMSTHDLELAAALADRVVVLSASGLHEGLPAAQCMKY